MQAHPHTTPPGTVQWATAAWAAAVAAGVVESVLAVAHAAEQGPLGPDIWAGAGVRFVVYATASVLIVHLSRGRRWARTSLTVLLTVIGLASLVVPAALAVADGQTMAQALSDGGSLGTAFVAVRGAHIAFVLVASVLMFTATANRYFARPALRTA